MEKEKKGTVCPSMSNGKRCVVLGPHRLLKYPPYSTEQHSPKSRACPLAVHIITAAGTRETFLKRNLEAAIPEFSFCKFLAVDPTPQILHFESLTWKKGLSWSAYFRAWALSLINASGYSHRQWSNVKHPTCWLYNRGSNFGWSLLNCPNFNRCRADLAHYHETDRTHGSLWCKYHK